MQAVYTKLHTWLNQRTPSNCPVIVSNQNAPTPPRPFVAFKVSSVVDIARDFSANVRDLNELPEGAEEPEEPLPEVWVLDVVRWVRLSVDVQIHARPGFTFEAEGIAQDLLDKAYNATANNVTLGRSMAFNLVLQSPQTVDGVIGAEFEPRVVMALGFSAARDFVYEVGAIDEVIMTGLVGTQTVQSEAKE